MRAILYILCGAAVSLLAGCRELPAYFKGGAPLAKAGHATLYLHEVERVAPEEMTGDDSAAFYRTYADRWVTRQLKLREAEALFSEEEVRDVEAMVEEYRQSLLIRKLDQSYVDRQIDTLFTDEDIQAYYHAHLEDFRSDRTLVKGRILRFPEGDRRAKQLLALMRATSPEKRKDLEGICSKQDFRLTELTAGWVDWEEFLSYLPTLRDGDYSPLLASSDVQQMRDSHSHYYFQLTAVRRAGEALPIERVSETIRRILFNQRQSELIRRREEERRREADREGLVKLYYEENEPEGGFEQ